MNQESSCVRFQQEFITIFQARPSILWLSRYKSGSFNCTKKHSNDPSNQQNEFRQLISIIYKEKQSLGHKKTNI